MVLEETVETVIKFAPQASACSMKSAIFLYIYTLCANQRISNGSNSIKHLYICPPVHLSTAAVQYMACVECVFPSPPEFREKRMPKHLCACCRSYRYRPLVACHMHALHATYGFLSTCNAESCLCCCWVKAFLYCICILLPYLVVLLFLLGRLLPLCVLCV